MKQLTSALILFVLIGSIGSVALINRSSRTLQGDPSLEPSALGADRKTSSDASEKHVFIIVEENKDYSEVIGNTKDMPYLNSLAQKYAYADNYYANTHPSIGNYFMLTTGKIITNNDNYKKVVDESDIVRELESKGKTWKAYLEDLPSAGYVGDDRDNYSQHHNPFSYFSHVRDNPELAKNLVPFSQLKMDMENDTLPNYAFIVPNEINDAHSCPRNADCNKLATADAWLKENISPLLESTDFSSPGGGILIITFDEASSSDRAHGGGHIAWVVAGPDVKPGYISHTFYQHQSTLRFMAEELGLSDYPGAAQDAPDMQEFLKSN